MAPSSQRNPQNTIAQDREDNLDTLLSEQVLHALGEPRDLLRVQVCKLWPGHYRVNVLVGADITSARVAHSYFVVSDADGNIGTAAPKIAKVY
jgi:hypothetical protein